MISKLASEPARVDGSVESYSFQDKAPEILTEHASDLAGDATIQAAAKIGELPQQDRKLSRTKGHKPDLIKAFAKSKAKHDSTNVSSPVPILPEVTLWHANVKTCR